MKPIISFLAAMSLAGAGCGDKPAPTVTTTTATGGGSLSMPTLAKDIPPPPGANRVGTVATGATSAPADSPNAVDFASGKRPNDPTGRPLSDLEWLNQIVQGYLMTASMPDASLPPGQFNNQDEEIAAQMAAMKKKEQAAAVRDLSDLVRAGVIKAIPAAPPGKKYAFDQKSGKVLMVNQ